MSLKEKVEQLTEEEFIELMDLFERSEVTCSLYNHIFFEMDGIPEHVKKALVRSALFPFVYDRIFHVPEGKKVWTKRRLEAFQNKDYSFLFEYFSEVELDLLEKMLETNDKMERNQLIYDYTLKWCRS